MIIIKESIFNINYDISDEEKLIFNSKGCGLAIADSNYLELSRILSKIKNENDVPNHLRETFEIAKEGMFIVEDDCDEIMDIQIKRNSQKYSFEYLGMTIAPTLACNFCCPYCYETSKPGMMTKDTEDNIVKLLERQSTSIKHFSVSWYGGEPLLAMNVISRLSEEFIRICSEQNIEYDAYMISNGYLLDDDTISKLIQYKVGGIQITIDGPPDVHNIRRRSKNGVPTFEKIVDNVNRILETGQIEVMLRINIDKTNSESVRELLRVLKVKLISNKVHISFGQVSAYTEACKSIEGSCFANNEFAKEIVQYYKIIEEEGFGEHNPLPYPEPRYNYCCADLINSFVIDTDGYMYKCWNEVGDNDRSIGNVNDPDLQIVSYKNAFWTENNPLIESKCKNCEVLPICMGGCPYNKLISKNDITCDLIKYNIRDVMLDYYNKLKEDDE